jgi:hypothetical protein
MDTDMKKASYFLCGLTLSLLIGATVYNQFSPGGALSGTWNSQNVNVGAGNPFITGVLPVPNGGTGAVTLAAHGVLLGEDTAAVTPVAAMAQDTLLQGQGVTSDPAAVPVNNCGSATQALSYSTSTHTFGCQTISAGSAALTATLIGYGSAGNLLTGTADFSWTDSTHTLAFGTATAGPTLVATTGSGTGTTFAITGSQGAVTSNGGVVNLTAGSGGATNGNGGALNLKAGSAPGGGNGGAIVMTAGAAGNVAGNLAGGVTIQAGAGTATTTGSPGAVVQILGGAATGSGNNNGGAVTLTAGAATAGGNGGVASLNGGVVGTTISNGYRNLILQAGNSSATIAVGSGSNAATSSVYIAGSTAATSSINGGDVLITGGLPNATSSVGGNLVLRTGGTAVAASNGNIVFQGINTSTGQPATFVTFNGNTGQFTSTLVGLGYVAGGSISVSGCSLSAATGGQTAGKFTSGTTGTCTVTVTLPAAPNGWACRASDITTVADVINQTASATTSCTISGTTATNDVIVFSAIGF